MPEGSSLGIAVTHQPPLDLPTASLGSLLVTECKTVGNLLLSISGSSLSSQAPVLPPALKGHSGSQSLLRLQPQCVLYLLGD